LAMIYGYARVSTAAQDETGQVRQLKMAGCEKVFREKISRLYLTILEIKQKSRPQSPLGCKRCFALSGTMNIL